MSVKYIQHINQVWPNETWRDKSNFIIGAHSEKEDQEVIEQIWSKQITDFTFEICCIPFFTYNISLGDIVKTDTNYKISEVIQPSGHYTFRVWFGDSSVPNIRETVVSDVTKMECQIEWYSENLLAIDASSILTAQPLADYLQEKENRMELHFETGPL